MFFPISRKGKVLAGDSASRWYGAGRKGRRGKKALSKTHDNVAKHEGEALPTAASTTNTDKEKDRGKYGKHRKRDEPKDGFNNKRLIEMQNATVVRDISTNSSSYNPFAFTTETAQPLPYRTLRPSIFVIEGTAYELRKDTLQWGIVGVRPCRQNIKITLYPKPTLFIYDVNKLVPIEFIDISTFSKLTRLKEHFHVMEMDKDYGHGICRNPSGNCNDCEATHDDFSDFDITNNMDYEGGSESLKNPNKNIDNDTLSANSPKENIDRSSDARQTEDNSNNNKDKDDDGRYTRKIAFCFNNDFDENEFFEAMMCVKDFINNMKKAYIEDSRALQQKTNNKNMFDQNIQKNEGEDDKSVPEAKDIKQESVTMDTKEGKVEKESEEEKKREKNEEQEKQPTKKKNKSSLEKFLEKDRSPRYIFCLSLAVPSKEAKRGIFIKSIGIISQHQYLESFALVMFKYLASIIDIEDETILQKAVLSLKETLNSISDSIPSLPIYSPQEFKYKIATHDFASSTASFRFTHNLGEIVGDKKAGNKIDSLVQYTTSDHTDITINFCLNPLQNMSSKPLYLLAALRHKIILLFNCILLEGRVQFTGGRYGFLSSLAMTSLNLMTQDVSHRLLETDTQILKRYSPVTLDNYESLHRGTVGISSNPLCDMRGSWDVLINVPERKFFLKTRKSKDKFDDPLRLAPICYDRNGYIEPNMEWYEDEESYCSKITQFLSAIISNPIQQDMDMINGLINKIPEEYLDQLSEEVRDYSLSNKLPNIFGQYDDQSSIGGSKDSVRNDNSKNNSWTDNSIYSNNSENNANNNSGNAQDKESKNKKKIPSSLLPSCYTDYDRIILHAFGEYLTNLYMQALGIPEMDGINSARSKLEDIRLNFIRSTKCWVTWREIYIRNRSLSNMRFKMDHEIRLLKVNEGLTVETVKSLLMKIDNELRSMDDLRELLGCLPLEGGGVTPLGVCLFHPNEAVRRSVISILYKIDSTDIGSMFIGKMNYMLVIAYDRMKRIFGASLKEGKK